MMEVLIRLIQGLLSSRRAAAQELDVAVQPAPSPSRPRPPPPTPGPGSWHCGIAGNWDLGTRGGTNKHVWDTAADDAVVVADGRVIDLPEKPGWQEVAAGVFVNRVPADHAWYVAARPTAMPVKLRSMRRVEVHYSDAPEFNQTHSTIEFRPLDSTLMRTPEADDATSA